jgi:IS4 transposase
MSLKTETAAETTTVTHLGREWTVPVRRHLSHILAAEARFEKGLALTGTFIVRTFLSDEEFAELVELDPTEDQIDDLAGKISEAIGTGDTGNSEPSSAAS